MNIVDINNSIIYHTYNFLPFKDIIKFSKVCKHFYTVFNEMPESLKLAIPKLDAEIIQQNADTLWKNPEGNFVVDHTGKLNLIPFTNITEIFFKWRNQNTINRKVNEIVEITFQEIYRLNQQGTLNCPNIFEHSTKGSKRFYVRQPLKDDNVVIYYAAYCFGDKILKSKQFANQAKINKAASLVINHKDIYTDIYEYRRVRYSILFSTQPDQLNKVFFT